MFIDFYLRKNPVLSKACAFMEWTHSRMDENCPGRTVCPEGHRKGWCWQKRSGLGPLRKGRHIWLGEVWAQEVASLQSLM